MTKMKKMTAASNMLPAPHWKATEKPCVVASGGLTPGGNAGPRQGFATANAAVALIAIVLKIAVPSDPPICCAVFNTAEATPDSWKGTLKRAVDDTATKTEPRPRLISKSAGSTDET